MEVQSLRATARTATRKGASRRLRATGAIPAIVYGPGFPSQSISLDNEDIHRLRRSALGLNQPVAIEVDGGERVEMAILRDVQRHPVSGALIHVDFLRLSEGRIVEIEVAIELSGKAIGEENGGRVSLATRRVRVACLPSAIPRTITVDVTAMNVGDKVMVSDLPLPPGVTAVTRGGSPIVTVIGKRGSDEKSAIPAPPAPPAAPAAAEKKA